jgi:L-alanine-DL-glutamate epimerase-like enolase superfamily enzyme
LGRVELEKRFKKAELAFDANPGLTTAKALSEARAALEDLDNKVEEYIVDARDTEEDKEIIEKAKQNIKNIKNQLK